MALLPATVDHKIDLAAGKALRKWVSIGRAPRRVYLRRWLQDRLELVRTNSMTMGSGSADEGVVGRCAGEYRLRLLESKTPSDDPMACAEVGTGAGEQKDAPMREKRAGKTEACDIAKPPDGGGETHGGDSESRELGSTSGTSASDVSGSTALSPTPAKPALGESITSDVPPDDVVGGAKSDAQKRIVDQVLERPFTIRGSVPSRRPRRGPLDETRDPSLSHHHSPSSPPQQQQQQQQRVQNSSRGDDIYSAPSKAGVENGKVSLTKSAGAVDDANGVPRAPSHRHGLFALDRSYAATTPSVFFNGRWVNAARTRGENGLDRESGCQKSRRQRRVSSVGSKHGYGSNEGPSTERGPQGSRWKVLTERRCMTATGDWERQKMSDLGGGRGRLVRRGWGGEEWG